MHRAGHVFHGVAGKERAVKRKHMANGAVERDPCPLKLSIVNTEGGWRSYEARGSLCSLLTCRTHRRVPREQEAIRRAVIHHMALSVAWEEHGLQAESLQNATLHGVFEVQSRRGSAQGGHVNRVQEYGYSKGLSDEKQG